MQKKEREKNEEYAAKLAKVEKIQEAMYESPFIEMSPELQE